MSSVNDTTINTTLASQVALTMNSPSLSNSPTLLGTPLELRHIIYRYIFGHQKIYGPIFVLDGHRSTRAKTRKRQLAVPSIMIVCKQIRREALQIYWENRQVWLTRRIYRYKYRYDWSRTSLYEIVPQMSESIRANIRHIRAENVEIENWGEMDRRGAPYLVRKFPNLKTFRLHGASRVAPFWTGIDQYPDVMELAVKTCGASFRLTNIENIINYPNSSRIQLEMVIIVTVSLQHFDKDYYILYINLNTRKHLFVKVPHNIGEDVLKPGYSYDEDVWIELRRKDTAAVSNPSS
ncbi:hypothetical protein F5Y18DRAFT_426089 [Xylariaceae sp. FL1019]|nr:hypothetical protein F5Y18DRAFT_426089 [Xylariaceae sp. FL1019]